MKKLEYVYNQCKQCKYRGAKINACFAGLITGKSCLQVNQNTGVVFDRRGYEPENCFLFIKGNPPKMSISIDGDVVFK